MQGLQAITFDAVIEAAGDEPDLTAQVDDPVPTPLFPPANWLAPIDGLPADIPVRVLPNGEIVGRFFQWGACILPTTQNDCWTPPPDPFSYDLFHQGDARVVLDGSVVRIPTGGLVPGHAPPTASDKAAQEHYNNPRLTAALVRAYEDDEGGYVHGFVMPGKTYAESVLIEGSALSGHWIWRGSVWACLGPCLVVRPGLPLERASAHIVERRAAVETTVANVRPYQVLVDGELRGWEETDDRDLVTAYVGSAVTQVNQTEQNFSLTLDVPQEVTVSASIEAQADGELVEAEPVEEVDGSDAIAATVAELTDAVAALAADHAATAAKVEALEEWQEMIQSEAAEAEIVDMTLDEMPATVNT